MKRALLLFFTSFVFFSVMAIPAKPGLWRVLTLLDGTEVRAELCGDEFTHYWKSEDGLCYRESQQEGFFERCDLSSISERSTAKRQRRSVKNQTRAKLRVNHTPYTGKKKGLIILVQFSNLSFQESHTKELYNDILNKENYVNDELGFKGSVKDYFLAQSNGQFELDFDIVGPLTMPNKYGYYGANDQDGNDSNPGLMTATACEMADEYVNYKDYDWDGDGEVDQVFIIFAGEGEAAGGGANTIWPHEWHLQYATGYEKKLTLDDTVIDTYACGPELMRRGSGIQSVVGIEGIGTICHEFTHCLGIPDMYDTAYNGNSGSPNYGMNRWDLMDQGSYNSGSFIPAGYTSFEKMSCGWLTPIILENDTTITGMKALSENGEAYILYNDAHQDEFFLLENRQKTGWDAGLPGAGLLVIHVDYDEELWQYNLVNNTTAYNGYNKFQRCTIIAADGEYASGQEFVATDPYPYNGNNKLTDNSTPRAYLNNKNSDGKKYMSKPITDITLTDGLISFNFKNEVKNRIPAGISSMIVDQQKDNSSIYNLHGRYMGTELNALPKGVYIIGGKKIIK